MATRFKGLTAPLAAVIVCGVVLPACPIRIEVGPIGLTLPVASGSMLRDVFGAQQNGFTFTFTREVCQLPSEEELAAIFQDVGGYDLSQFIRLSRLTLDETRITATEGDFNFLSSMTVRYIPAPENGQEQEPVVLGAASNSGGLGTQVSLLPPDPVDFLELIRRNDANTSGECPALEVEVTLRSLPLRDTEYEVEVDIGAYALITSRRG